MSTDRLKGKRSIVTGSAMGLGEAIATRFAQEDSLVVCVDVEEERNELVVESIRSRGGEAWSVIGDVGYAAEVERIVREATAHLGGVDVLVNNAGVIPSRETAADTTEEDWDETFRVNAKGVFLMSRAVVSAMVEQGGGSIVNMSSIAGLVGLPVRSAYCSTKGAVVQLTRQMAVDFGPDGIRVNAINPSFVITDINRALFEDMRSRGDAWERLLSRHPLRRLGDTDDVANAALFLASDEARWITGVCLPVDGGYTAS